MNTPRRSVGGAAQGPITPSPGSSPGVSIPFGDTSSIRVLRRMLRFRDAEIDALNARYTGARQAALYRAGGANAKSQGRVAAGTALVNNASKIF